jgi:hypothetical protein
MTAMPNASRYRTVTYNFTGPLARHVCDVPMEANTRCKRGSNQSTVPGTLKTFDVVVPHSGTSAAPCGAVYCLCTLMHDVQAAPARHVAT